MPSQRGHMPPSTVNDCFFAVFAPPFHGDRAGRAHRRHVERERVRRPDVRRAQAAEQHAQHRVRVGRGADGRARVRAHALLIDDDRGRQSFEHVDVGARQRRHEALQERAVRLVDEPLRLGGDRAEHERRLARARDAGEHRQPALRDLDADVLQVVLARALHANQVVLVGRVRGRRAVACGHRAASAVARARRDRAVYGSANRYRPLNRSSASGSSGA